MSATTNPSAPPVENSFAYRPVPALAPITLVCGLLGLLGFLTEFILPVALLGLALGLACWRQFQKFPEEFSGQNLLRSGMVLCSLCLVGGTAWHVYDYRNEVPEGYRRVSFVKDISRKEFVVRDGRQEFHEDVAALEGEKLFLKGYIYPPEQMDGLTSFILCKDSGQCCFGGNPKLSDMIHVVIADDTDPATYYQGLVSVAGTFKLNDLSRTGSLKPAYVLEATHFQIARKLY